MEELFTTTQLTSFGQYLLSPERTRSILASDLEGDPVQLLAMVHNADFENWKAKVGGAGVEMGEEAQIIQPDLSAWQQSK